VLDEPTNHLDLESREALEAALLAFPGSVLLVTHDRALLDAVSGRLLAIESQRLVSYPGGWAEYLGRREPDAEPAPRAARPPKEKPRRQRPPAPTPLELVEREIARTEERIAEVERQLADDWTNVDLANAHRAARDDLSALLTRWERLFEETHA
jgi:ATP-binding cassette, subfamily F, member 3